MAQEQGAGDWHAAAGTHVTDRRVSGAIRLAMVMSVIGAAGKLAAGLASGSTAMVSSALDSLGDILVSAVNLWVVRFSDAPPDEEHNYGHARVEGLGAMFEGGFIFAAGGVVLFTAVRRLWAGDAGQAPGMGLAVMVPVLAMTAGTVAYMRKVARESGSLVLKADALHYATDIWMNGGVLVSLLVVKQTGWWWVDPAVSVAIGLFMLRAARGIVLEGFDVVLDRSLDRPQVERVEAILRGTAGVESFHDLRTRAGKVPHVDVHVVVQPEMTALALHGLFETLRDRVQGELGPSARVLMHADPLGHDEPGT